MKKRADGQVLFCNVIQQPTAIMQHQSFDLFIFFGKQRMRKIKMKHGFLLISLFYLQVSISVGQDSKKGTLSLESELQAIAQRGYSIGGYYWLPDSQWNVGLMVAGSEQRGGAKATVWTNGESLDRSRNAWLVAARVRYFFKKNAKGFYANLNVGYEGWDIEKGNQSGTVNNWFATPFLGYTWFLKGNKGFYLQPALGAIFIFGQTPLVTLSGVNYQINPVLPNPTVTLGFKFR